MSAFNILVATGPKLVNVTYVIRKLYIPPGSDNYSSDSKSYAAIVIVE